jgi:hypothetical protein
MIIHHRRTEALKLRARIADIDDMGRLILATVAYAIANAGVAAAALIALT